MSVWLLVMALVPVVMVATLIVLVARKMLVVCQPNEAWVISGAPHLHVDGDGRAFKIVTDGRFVCVPILQTAERLDLTLQHVRLVAHAVFTADDQGLDVTGAVDVRIGDGHEQLQAAARRFLGRSREEIAAVTRDTLEAQLRARTGTLLRDDILSSPDRLTELVRGDLDRELELLGLVVETCGLQEVVDAR